MGVQLSKKECIFFICLILFNKLILSFPSLLISVTGTGTTINLIYIGIIALVFISIINKGFKNFPNSDILDISKILGGKTLKTIIGIIYMLLFFTILITFLNDFTNLLKSIYYQNSPTIFILLFFIIGILISNLIGFNSIIKMINLLFPIILISIFISFIGTIDNFTLDKLTPIFGYNHKTSFLDGLVNIFTFSFIGFYYFLQPLLKKPEDFKKINYISFFISFGLLFITICSILTLLPVASTGITINPLYILSRDVSFSVFLQRLDALFILFWILALLCYLSSLVFFINIIFSKIFNVLDIKMPSYLICMLLLACSLYPFNIGLIEFLENIVLKYAIISIVFILGPIILILGNIKFRTKSRKELNKNVF